MSEYRLRVAPEATVFPTDWNVIGARIITAARQAATQHLKDTAAWVAAIEADRLGEQVAEGE